MDSKDMPGWSTVVTNAGDGSVASTACVVRSQIATPPFSTMLATRLASGERVAAPAKRIPLPNPGQDAIHPTDLPCNGDTPLPEE